MSEAAVLDQEGDEGLVPDASSVRFAVQGGHQHPYVWHPVGERAVSRGRASVELLGAGREHAFEVGRLYVPREDAKSESHGLRRQQLVGRRAAGRRERLQQGVLRLLAAPVEDSAGLVLDDFAVIVLHA